MARGLRAGLVRRLREEIELRPAPPPAVLRLQALELPSRLPDHLARNPRELRDLDPVAAARGARRHLVQEHDPAVVLDRLQVHIRDRVVLDAKRGELEVMGSEEGERPEPRGKVRAGRPREGEPVVGAGPAADLVEEDEALRGRIVEDVRRLGHLDHEGRTPPRKVVRGADAGVDPVHRADDRGLGGDEASRVGKEHDVSGLAHVGRLSAHVGTGDDEHPSLRPELEIVGHEGRLCERLHHEVPSGPNPDPGLLAQLGAAEPELDRAVRET